MGVSTECMVYWGIRLEWNHDLNERFEEFWEEDRESELPGHVFDGMSCEYMVLGVQLWNGGDIRYGLEGGQPFTQQDVSELALMEAKYKEKFCNQFPEFAQLMDQPFKLCMFSHYS
jgi:hypothetical protein